MQSSLPPLTVHFTNNYTVNHFYSSATTKEKAKPRQFAKTPKDVHQSTFPFESSLDTFYNKKIDQSSISNLNLLPIQPTIKSISEIKNIGTEENLKSELDNIENETKEKIIKKIRVGDEKRMLRSQLIGVGLIIFSLFFFVWFWTSLGLILLGNTGMDYTMIAMVPLFIPIIIIAIYGNWVSMKFFRHS